MPFRLAIGATLAALLLIPSSGSAQVLMQRDVSLRMALTIAEAALAECGVRTSVAVVDRAGRLRVFLQGDGASPHNLELARRKAYTARTFRRPSAEWAKLTETTNTGQRMLADVIPLGGGVPINGGEDTIGGVGLSGAPMAQASSCACPIGAPLRPTPPIVSSPTLIGTPPPSGITSASIRCPALVVSVSFAHSADGRRKVRAV